jgi:hypothetical protein
MRATRLALGLLACALLAGCGGAATSGMSSANAGTVVDRTEGFAERPGWADADNAFSRSGNSVRVVGYVAIGGEQRIETGYRAADSYARAELIRFLSVRVVAVLQDDLKAGEPGVLSERLEQTASSWVDELIIAQRYYEKRKDGDVEKVHIWSRLDIDQAAVTELLQRATADAEDLRGRSETLIKALAARWDEVSTSILLVPAGVFTPEWAKKGDQEESDTFQFVCYGLAEDEATARALARARCNEKLCRLFGVQITARTTVTENLEGISAESEVSEQCADIRVKGRETLYQTNECGPRGCVQWLMQSYPKSAYEEERKRLDQPTTITQQVVIQEGDKVYRDPAQCEAALRAYGAVPKATGPEMAARKKHLIQALKVCQDIDSRDSGLFLSLSQLLTAPLVNFTNDNDDLNDERVRARAVYVYAGARWKGELETKRFLTDRIQAVLKLVNDAILPMKLLDVIYETGGDRATVDALMKEVVKLPFGDDEPVSPHHLRNLHTVAVQLIGKNIAASPLYGGFLLDQADRGVIKCTRGQFYSTLRVLEYWGSDGVLDEREWKTAIAVIRAGDKESTSQCMGYLFRKLEHRGNRIERIDQIAGLIGSGAFHYKDNKALFSRFLGSLEDAEAPAVMLRWHTKIPGAAEAESKMVNDVLYSSFLSRSSKTDDLARCTAMADAVRPIFEQIPAAKTSSTYLCECLRQEGLPARARNATIELLFKYGDKGCNNIKPEEWPGGFYDGEQPAYRRTDSAAPFYPNDAPFEAEIKTCIEQSYPLKNPQTATLVTARLAGRRLTKVKADTKLHGDPRNYERKEGRGYHKASEVRSMNESAGHCIAKVFEGFELPDRDNNTAKRAHIWFQLWNDNLAGNGYEP